MIHGSYMDHVMDHIIHQHLWDTCGIRPKNILIHDQIHQIHVSIWGVIGPILGGKRYYARGDPRHALNAKKKKKKKRRQTLSHI